MPGPVEAPPTTAVVIAAALLEASHRSATARERRQQRRMAAVVADKDLRELTFALTDEVLRVDEPQRAAARFATVVADIGAPRSLGLLDRSTLVVGAKLAPLVPRLVMPLVRARLIRESNGVVLPAGDPKFADHVARRRTEGFRLNVNVLGEAILSDVEAARRTSMLRERIARPDVHYVSLKISAICANLDVLAFEHSVARIADGLRDLYRCAQRSSPPTCVNLDMEEYRDLPLTVAAMQRVLDVDEFAGIDAGIVLQAYLPDSHQVCRELCEWAVARHERSGGRLKIRVVKGANLAMERVDAELHGWPQAPYETKLDVDASFKALIGTVLQPRHAGAVRVGIASHNLFDIAWAMGLAERDQIDLEMLEGMVPAQSRAVLDAAGDVLLYAPIVGADDLAASIAYLTRRLDENTAPDNFLRALFTLEVGAPDWNDQCDRFERSVALVPDVSTSPRRTQNRTQPPDAPHGTSRPGEFVNAADTDWTLAVNRRWVTEHLAAAVNPAVNVGAPPLLSTVAEIDTVIDRASASAWPSTTFEERRRVLYAVAALMEQRRGDTLAVMAAEACKTVAEGDPEVSEAVDFAGYYAWCTHDIERRLNGTHGETMLAGGAEGGSVGMRSFIPLGVVVVASPWNFPYAIPAGGVLAALAAGDAVVLKPAPEVRATAWLLVNQMWDAGVPCDALQFVACADDEAGRRLITHPDVSTVVLTGAFDTAMMFLDWKPSLRLLAETSGKNAIVITAAADEDAAIADVVRSAFGHAGQKCSAASLIIVEASLYDDPRFRVRLADAVRSIRVGPATDLATTMGPLIAPPGGSLRRGLTELDEGETWLVEPRWLDAAQCQWSPGVRWGVRPGSWFHHTECFGPVLGVLRANDLDHAIEIQNMGDYGLTGGIQSLDEHEVERWLDRVEVGNAYVNRHITGAIVQRQPFGGWKHSSVGCGPKAGGPAYVEAFGRWSGGVADPEAFEREWAAHFALDHDPSALRSERNILRYRPLRRVVLLAGSDVSAGPLRTARLAARVASVDIDDVDASAVDTSAVEPSVVEATVAAIIERCVGADRVRCVGTIDDGLRRRLREAPVNVDDAPVTTEPRAELQHWVREQALSITRHRHGRLLP